jgi:hypothetical protein
MKTKSLLRSMALASLLLAAPLALRAHNGVVHGDHDAHHGGFVMMYRDLHCEVVVQSQGTVQLYLTDAARADLPAAVVSDVTVEIERKGAPIENVRMAISAGGDFWEGKSRPVSPKDTTVHAAFVFQREPVVVNLPASSVMGSAVKVAPAASSSKPKAAGDSMGGMEHHGH